MPTRPEIVNTDIICTTPSLSSPNRAVLIEDLDSYAEPKSVTALVMDA
jgi:hypothetical protein